MPLSHNTKKHRLAMTGGVVAISLFVLCFFAFGTTVYSSALRGDIVEDELLENASVKNNTTSESTIELLHVIFRHGPRTPADTYPNDPHVDEKFEPFGWGQLTNNGKRELFNVGSWLRKRYNHYLGSLYVPDYVHAQTTGVTRTYMSMATVLASLWPPKNTPMEWNSKYNWQPIPIWSQPLEEDNLLLVRTPCPRYYEALKEVFQLPEVRAEIDQYESLFQELTELTGLNVTTPEDVQSIYTTLLAESEFGLTLPDWTKKYYPDEMQFLAEQSYIYSVYTPEMQKIKAGPFLRKMLKEMSQKRAAELSPKDRKLFIYTGHDTSLVNILRALGVWERQMPRYSIMALFELHKNKKTGEYHVEIFLRNNPKTDAKPLTIPGCDRKCPLDKFIELTKDVVPSEKSLSSCSAKDPNFTEPPPSGP